MRATDSVILRVTNSRPRRATRVEQSPDTANSPIALAVVHGDPVTVELGHRVGLRGYERRRLGLRRLANHPNIRARSLIEADLRSTSRPPSSSRVTPSAVNSPVSVGCSQLVGTNDCRARL
jgi:hypothetical protein